MEERRDTICGPSFTGLETEAKVPGHDDSVLVHIEGGLELVRGTAPGP